MIVDDIISITPHVRARDDAQSLGGFTAALVASRVTVERIVFVNATIPLPGETAGDYWGHTRGQDAREAAARRHGYVRHGPAHLSPR
jgi:hypothetical protein